MEEQSRQVSAETELPLGVRVAAAWSWRLIIIGAAIAALLWLIVQVRVLVVPVMVAILLTALLQPIVTEFVKRGWPRWAGVVTALLAFLLAVTALVWLIVSQLRGGFGDVARRSSIAWNDFLEWIESAPFGLSA
ncbi:MAG: AI-2E family transporter, partial [Actinobacteria bacterium]|nr:AI-2E family transporter [Actinomycetota bacterium]